MKTQYEVRGWTKIAEEDNYENGCNPDSAFFSEGHHRFEADTVEELIDNLCAFSGGERENVEINTCDEPGRIDIQVMEKGNGEVASEKDFELFKQNKCKLWSADYIFQVEKVTREIIEINSNFVSE